MIDKDIKNFYYLGTIDRILYEKIKDFKCGSYILYDDIDDMYYVGVTNDFINRFKGHSITFKNPHSEIYLYYAMDSYTNLRNIENITLKFIIEKVGIEKLHNKQLKSNYRKNIKNININKFTNYSMEDEYYEELNTLIYNDKNYKHIDFRLEEIILDRKRKKVKTIKLELGEKFVIDKIKEEYPNIKIVYDHYDNILFKEDILKEMN